MAKGNTARQLVTVSPDTCESVEKDLQMMNLAFDCLAHSVKVLEHTVVRSVGTVGLCFEAFVNNNKKGVKSHELHHCK
jgi:hypothetical protein